MSSPILAFSLISENGGIKSSDNLQIHKIKKEVPLVYNELEDNEEETDFLPIFTFQAIDFFGLDSAVGEVLNSSYSDEQSTSLHIHLPLWLANKQIIQ